MELKNISIEDALKQMGACRYPRTVKGYGRAWKYAYENCSKNSLYEYLALLTAGCRTGEPCINCRVNRIDSYECTAKQLREMFPWKEVKKATLEMLFWSSPGE